MSYTKNIAVIKGVKDGFSADGGALSGLVKAEKYSNSLKIEVNLINFAPLTEGRYVVAISDGLHTEFVENCAFEGHSAVDTCKGFAAVICYVNGSVQLLASAVCGNFHGAAFGLKGEIERAEKIKCAENSGNKPAAVVRPEDVLSSCEQPATTDVHDEIYEDEAISEVNYYELAEADEGGGPVCENAQKEEEGVKLFEDEKDFGAVEKGARAGLARGGFYEKMKSEIEGLLSAYPRCEELEKIVEGSKWVRINYGDNKFYVFGVIFAAGVPRYICYGLPSFNATDPPESMRYLSSFLPVETAFGSGFWVMYQDADTGASVTVSPC